MSDHPRNPRNRPQIIATVAPSVAESLRELAAIEKRPISHIVEAAIRAFIKRSRRSRANKAA